MTDSQYQITPESRPVPSRWTGEKTAWWIVFGVLVLGIFVMLGAWN